MGTFKHASKLGRPGLAAAGALALAGLMAWWWGQPMPAPPPAAAPAASFPWDRTPVAVQAPPEASPAPPAERPPQAAPAAGPLLDPTTLAFKPAQRPMFRADARGQLVLDEHTRLQVEKLLAMHGPDEVLQRLDSETATLPAGAAAQARELVQRFEAYQIAQRQAFATGVAPLVPEEGLAQLQTMQAMRASHFGTEAAQRMFGQEDAVTRRLLELMRQETDTRLSMAERAARAQARFDLERGAFKP